MTLDACCVGHSYLSLAAMTLDQASPGGICSYLPLAAPGTVVMAAETTIVPTTADEGDALQLAVQLYDVLCNWRMLMFPTTCS